MRKITLEESPGFKMVGTHPSSPIEDYNAACDAAWAKQTASIVASEKKFATDSLPIYTAQAKAQADLDAIDAVLNQALLAASNQLSVDIIAAIDVYEAAIAVITPPPTPPPLPPPPPTISLAGNTSDLVSTPVIFTPIVAGGTPPFMIGVDFGDGSPPVTNAPSPISHTFAKSGNYSIVATVTDANAQTASITHPITISDSLPPPPPAGIPQFCFGDATTVPPAGYTLVTPATALTPGGFGWQNTGTSIAAFIDDPATPLKGSGCAGFNSVFVCTVPFGTYDLSILSGSKNAYPGETIWINGQKVASFDNAAGNWTTTNYRLTTSGTVIIGLSGTQDPGPSWAFHPAIINALTITPITPIP